MLDSLGQCFILSLLQVVYCVRFCFFVLFSVCLVRYVLFGFVRISLFRWSVRFSVRSLILSSSPFHRTWLCLILAVFSCEDHTNSFPSGVLIHSVYYHHKCTSISVIYGLYDRPTFETPGNLSGPTSNYCNYNPLALKNFCPFNTCLLYTSPSPRDA